MCVCVCVCVCNNDMDILCTQADSYSSIEQLTEMFVSGLQAEYPNTVSTIFR